MLALLWIPLFYLVQSISNLLCRLLWVWWCRRCTFTNWMPGKAESNETKLELKPNDGGTLQKLMMMLRTMSDCVKTIWLKFPVWIYQTVTLWDLCKRGKENTVFCPISAPPPFFSSLQITKNWKKILRSQCRSVCRSVGWSVPLYFFCIFAYGHRPFQGHCPAYIKKVTI